MKISDAIRGRFRQMQENIAQSIHNGEWSALVRIIALILAALLAVIASVVAILALAWKVLCTLLGKIFAVPMLLLIVMFIIGVVYTMFFENSRVAHKKKRKDKTDPPSWEEWADGIYEYVRDAMFLVLRAISEYTNIITPKRPSAIELTDNPYTIEDEYVVFNFMARTCGTVDTEQLRKDIRDTLKQMHRSHELNGFSRDLTEINGSYYCPLQILGVPQDYGDHVQVAIVFATEKTISLTMMRKVLNLSGTGRNRGPRGATLTDDEI